jgi:hypothetical protein
MGNCRTRKLGVCVSVVVLGTIIACTMLAYTAFASPVAKHDTLQQVVFVSSSFVTVGPVTLLFHFHTWSVNLILMLRLMKFKAISFTILRNI